MYNHAPPDYICPFCLLVRGTENEHVWVKQTDIVSKNDFITSFIGLAKWPNNAGHVIVLPNEHIENIYTLPKELSAEIHQTAQAIALAMKTAYACDGIMLRQHNEPAAGQSVWHYHLHVIPRYENDNIELSEKEDFPANERAEYALKLKTELD